MPHIEYNAENCMKCQCAACPVEAMSACTMAKRPKWIEMRRMMRPGMSMGSGSMGGGMGGSMSSESMGGGTMGMPQGTATGTMEMGHMEMLKPAEMIGLYCSSEIGKAACNDLDPSQSCMCPTCDVWTENSLKQQHYCTEGDADQRG